MARRPIRVYKKSTRGLEQIRDPMPVYRDGTDTDRLKITQQVVEYPPSHESKTTEVARARYQRLLNSSYDAVLLTNLEGEILEVNTRAEYNFVVDADELVGARIFELISGADEKLLDVIRRNVSSQRYTILEAVCVRGDDTTFPAEIVANCIEAEDRLCFCVRDVTARKKAEEELKAAHQKLVQTEGDRARLEILSTLYYELNNPLQILSSMAELEHNEEYATQLNRIVTVLNQLQGAESSEDAPPAPAE